MNERIRELAEQAESAANCGDHVDVVLMMEEFAKLLVQECTDTLVLEHRKANGQHNYYLVIINRLKKHFGVEE